MSLKGILGDHFVSNIGSKIWSERCHLLLFFFSRIQEKVSLKKNEKIFFRKEMDKKITRNLVSKITFESAEFWDEKALLMFPNFSRNQFFGRILIFFLEKIPKIFFLKRLNKNLKESSQSFLIISLSGINWRNFLNALPRFLWKNFLKNKKSINTSIFCWFEEKFKNTRDFLHLIKF